MWGEGEIRVRCPFTEFGGDRIPSAGTVAVDSEGKKKLFPSSPGGGGNVQFAVRCDTVGFGHERRLKVGVGG